MNNWREGAEIGRIYLIGEDIASKVGTDWMRGRLKPGDVCLCIKHSGDCFNQYILLEVGSNYVKGIPASEFGDCVFAREPLRWTPTDREFHLLCAGEAVKEVSERDTLKQEIEALLTNRR